MKFIRINAFLILSLLLVSLTVSAQTSEQEVRRHLGKLASDDFSGRRTGESGAKLAGEYVADQFKKAGLKPASGESFMQFFPFITGVEPAKTGNGFFYKTRAGASPIRNENARVVGFSPDAMIEGAPLVFAGFGIEAAESNYNDLVGVDVKGKIVVVFDGHPEGANQRTPLARFSVHFKAKQLKDKGALAMVIISNESDLSKERLTPTTYDPSTGESAIPVFVSTMKSVATMLGLSESDLAAVKQSLVDRKDVTAVAGIKTETVANVGVKMEKKETQAFNVIGVIPGTDPKLKDEYIVIGAHYDHLGRGGRSSLAPDSNDIHYGADDNASGTSALIELARQFAGEKKNRRTLVFMGFGAEEEGLLGSKFYVNNPIFPIENTVAMFNMDMVGRLTDGKLTVGGVGSAEGYRALVEAANSATTSAGNGSGLFNLQLNEDGFGPSDHASFYGKQIPVLFFFTGTHTDYHKPSDTADRINYQGLVKIADFVKGLVGKIDADDARPVYKQAQAAQQGPGRMSFNVTIGVIPGYGDDNNGMLLDGVRDGSPAAKAGLKANDKVISFAGREVRNAQDYTFVLGELKANTEYEIIVMRGTERLVLKVVPAARQ
jgi:aminopeptidase YwaD